MVTGPQRKLLQAHPQRDGVGCQKWAYLSCVSAPLHQIIHDLSVTVPKAHMRNEKANQQVILQSELANKPIPVSPMDTLVMSAPVTAKPKAKGQLHDRRLAA